MVTKKAVPSVKLETKAETAAVETVSTNQGGNMGNKIVPILTVLVIVGAFAVGYLYGKVNVYEKVGGTAIANKAAETGAGDSQAQEPQAPAAVNLTEEQINQIKEKAVAVKGDKNAKVTVVEFTDYQCPFCSRYYTDAYGKIVKDYVDTGKTQYIFMDLPLPFHPNAKQAALAARCAGDQDTYWEMHDVLFEKQTEWSEESDPAEAFKQYAKELGLKTNDFNACYDEGKYNEAIDEALTLAQSVGANGTPTFYINNKQLVGALPFSEFQKALDEALAE